MVLQYSSKSNVENERHSVPDKLRTFQAGLIKVMFLEGRLYSTHTRDVRKSRHSGRGSTKFVKANACKKIVKRAARSWTYHTTHHHEHNYCQERQGFVCVSNNVRMPVLIET